MGDHSVKKLDIERYRTGELSKPECCALEAHLKICPSCTAYHEQLAGEGEEFLRLHPYGDSALVRTADREEVSWWARISGMLAAPQIQPVLVPLCVILLMAVVIGPFVTMMQRPGSRSATTYYKGTAGLTYIFKRDGVVHEQSVNDTLYAGDEMMIYYTSIVDRYVSLFSIDTKGMVSFYHPGQSSDTCSIKSGVGTHLVYPSSIVLDDAQGGELVVAVFSTVPLTTSFIRSWVDRCQSGTGADLRVFAGTLERSPPLPGAAVSSLLVIKGNL